MKVLIIGGVAGGATAAARLRRLSEDIEIVLFERGKYISYANCGLPYYIGGVIKERDNLFIQTPESFSKRYNIDVRTENEVIKIIPEEKAVEVKNLRTGEIYKENYDKLLLSPGAEPLRPPIPGIENDKIFTLRNVDDTDRIKKYITEHKPHKAVVVGAGFIGLEMAENLFHAGAKVTIVEASNQVMAPLDFEMAAEIHQSLKTLGVELYLNDAVSSFEQDQTGRVFVKLKSGRSIPSDIVILSIGVRPETKLAKEAGIETDQRGHIIVNEYLQTNIEDIYAVGDAIIYKNPILNKPFPSYLAGPANKEARIVADNIVLGNVRKFKGAINTAIAKVFDLTVAATGVAEKILRDTDIEYQDIISHHSSHAGYYPNALPLTQKIIYDKKTKKLLSAQIVGYEGVDKLIDVYATVIGLGGTIYDLQEIEHAYAPPYSSAKSPVNYAGFIAENIEKGMVKVINWDEFDQLDIENIIVLDVRTPDEYSLGHITKAINIPLDELRNRLNELDKNKKIIVYCGTGLRSYLACRILLQNGFTDVYNYNGGYKTYEHVHQKQSNEDIFENDEIGKDDLIYKKSSSPKIDVKVLKVDACGLQCPGPIMKLKEAIENAKDGEIVEIVANDPGFYRDVKAWCDTTGNELVDLKKEGVNIVAKIRKSDLLKSDNKVIARGDNKTIIVFSDDLDRVMASFVIANGAASMGKKVSMFFTFWGLNVLKKENLQNTDKSFVERLLALMTPKGVKSLKLSKLNMGGLGTKMLKQRMKELKINSLEEMIETAKKNGIKFIACQMTMDMFGITKEELMDGVEVGGVATYLNEAEKSNVNLFI